MRKPRINRSDDLPHHMGVINDHAGAQMVRIVGLDGTDMAKKITVQGFSQALFGDVIRCNVRIDARLHITCGIYMEVTAATGNASLNISPVVPEIQYKHRTLVPDGQNLFS